MSDTDPLIGQQIDQYQVTRRIGQGGMAAVYLARDTSLERDIVLKILLPHLAENKEIRDRFNREAKATARLQHPNIVPIYATGVFGDSRPAGSRPYIALQYIDGGSLDEYLRRLAADGQWISTIYALSIVRQIADALRVAHQANIIHRDLKPANILLRQDGTGGLEVRSGDRWVDVAPVPLPAAAWLLLGDSLAFPAAALAGFLLGFAAGAESDLIAYLTGRYFGMANYGKIYGMLYMPFGLFSAASPVIYAQVYDRTGSYDPILEISIFMFIAGGALLLLLGRYPTDFPEAEDDTPEATMEPA